MIFFFWVNYPEILMDQTTDILGPISLSRGSDSEFWTRPVSFVSKTRRKSNSSLQSQNSSGKLLTQTETRSRPPEVTQNGVPQHGRGSSEDNGLPKPLLRRRFLPRRSFPQTAPFSLRQLSLSSLPRRCPQRLPGPITRSFILIHIMYA